MSGDDEETFTKRSGTTDLGKEYEHRLITNFVYKLIIDPQVANFQLSSNDDKKSCFDDIFLDIEYADQTRKAFGIQTKQSGNEKTLTKDALCASSGKFSIKTLFGNSLNVTSHLDSLTFVVFTTLSFSAGAKQDLVFKEDDFKVTLEKCQHENLLNTHEKGQCFKFSCNGRKYDSFFRRFYLYTNQASVNRLKIDTVDALKKRFRGNEETYEQILKFVTEWSLVEKKEKLKLNKKMMIRVTGLRLLTPYLVPLNFDATVGCTESAKIVKEAMSKFKITCISTCQEEVSTMWSDVKMKLSLQNLNKINRKFQITSYITDIENLSNAVCTKLLWLLKLCPLPLVANQVFESFLDLSDDNFIVFGETNCQSSVFRKLSDLDSETYTKVTRDLKIWVQGKEFTLESVLTQNKELEDLITTKELVQMAMGSLKIGGNQETLPEPHIDRFLTRNLITWSFLNEVKNSLIVVTNVNKNDEQKMAHLSVKNLKSMKDLEWYHNFIKINLDSEQEILFLEGECSALEILNIYNQLPKIDSYHQFRMIEGQLEWVRSDNVKPLHGFRSNAKYINQEELFSMPVENTVNIVCSDPGMGKSILMKNLKNCSKFWSILVEPKDHTQYFRRKNTNVDQFVKYICEKWYGNEKFDCEYLNIVLKRGEVIFIWDGLDEVAEENLDVVLEIINNLSENSCCWLTSRRNLASTLEMKFNVLSRDLQEFDVEQQSIYIEKRLNCENLQDIKMKIFKCINLVKYNDMLGIPLQIYMFTELFRQDPEKYRKLLSDVFSLTDLYHHFVNEKFNIFHKTKTNLSEMNDIILRIIESHKQQTLERYEEVAIRTYFQKEVAVALKIDCDAFLDDVKMNRDGVGIIVAVSDDKIPRFQHNSYGEYFAACFLFKNHQRIANLVNFIFDQKFHNIRFLFDLLMASSSTAHVAVLYKNLQLLEIEDMKFDHGGRNPLHVACCWGSITGDESKEDLKHFHSILTHLAQKCDPYQVDRLFRLNCFQYCDVSGSMYSILAVANLHKFDVDTLTRFKSTHILLNAVRYDFADVFEQIPFVYVNRDESLLHFAVKCESVNCVKKMLMNEGYKDLLNFWGKYAIFFTVKGSARPELNEDRADILIKNTPFLIACRNGNVEIGRLLKDAGADLNVITNEAKFAIYLAAENGHESFLRFLLQSGVDINFCNDEGETALHLFCENPNFEAAELVIKLGADVNFYDNYMMCPLYLACRSRCRAIVNLILTNGGNVNLRNMHDDTPLFMAAWNGDLEIVQMLVEYEAEVNAFNKKGNTPLHAACITESLDVINFLIEAKADVNKQNKYGDTPLHTCVKHNKFGGISLLLKSKIIDVGIRNRSGNRFWEVPGSPTRELLENIVIEARGVDFWNILEQQFDNDTTKERACLIS